MHGAKERVKASQLCNDASNNITKFRHVLDMLNSFTRRKTASVVEYGQRMRVLLSSGFCDALYSIRCVSKVVIISIFSFNNRFIKISASSDRGLVIFLV